MTNDIDSIFKSITPDNIQQIPVIAEAMDVFVSTLNELSAESIDIANAFKNTQIKEELVKIYLDDLYNALQNIQFNETLVDYINRRNSIYTEEYYKTEIIYNIANHINDEHFLTIKSYKENKGTKQAIQYIYDLITTFVATGDTPFPFTLIEKEPFNFAIQGAIPEVFYENIIRPIAHPLGFTYTYEQILLLHLEDFYAERARIYTFTALEVRCLQPDGTTTTTDYLVDGNGDTRIVWEIQTLFSGSTRVKKIIFMDGTGEYNKGHTYLQQTTTALGQTTVAYMKSVVLGVDYIETDPDWKKEDIVLHAHSNHCSIYNEFVYILNPSLEEAFDTFEESLEGDHYARLDPYNNFPVVEQIGGDDGIGGNADDPVIGQFQIDNNWNSPDRINLADAGWNELQDRNNDYIGGVHIGDGTLINGFTLYGVSRQENYYAPSEIADLKLLQGKYKYDFPIIDKDGIPRVQSVKYTDGVFNLPVVPFVTSIRSFQQQNVGNEDYLAQEHYVETNTDLLSASGHENIYVETAYDGQDFTDYNGTHWGILDTTNPLIVETIPLIGGGQLIGDGTFVGFTNVIITELVASDGSTYNSYTFSLEVDGDVVNLQLETPEIIEFTFSFEPMVDIFDDAIEGELSHSETQSLSDEDWELDSSGTRIALIENGSIDINSSESDVWPVTTENVEFTVGSQTMTDDMNSPTDSEITSSQDSDFVETPYEFAEGTGTKIALIESEESVQTFKIHEESIYSTIQHEQTPLIGSQPIGAFGALIGYITVSETVDSDVYINSWNDGHHESIDFGVYRNGILLVDNNIASV